MNLYFSPLCYTVIILTFYRIIYPYDKFCVVWHTYPECLLFLGGGRTVLEFELRALCLLGKGSECLLLKSWPYTSSICFQLSGHRVEMNLLQICPNFSNIHLNKCLPYCYSLVMALELRKGDTSRTRYLVI
jgi:hypothetical protein